MNQQLDNNLKMFIAKLKDRFEDRLKRIILFGSRARGDNSSESDYDLLLIFDHVSEDVREFVDTLEDEMLLEHFVLFSTFLLSEAEFNKRRYDPYLMNARKEGVAL
jgi:predicted nucleotidyltransferase